MSINRGPHACTSGGIVRLNSKMTNNQSHKTLSIEYKSINELQEYDKNARTHSDEQVNQIVQSINEYGWTNPILIDEHNSVIAGHGRLLAAMNIGYESVPVIQLVGLTESQKRAYRIADNKLPLNAGWDDLLLQEELRLLLDDGFDLDLTGFTDDEINQLLDEVSQLELPESRKGNLSDKFLIPPFTVFNAREGWWQERKKSWIELGIQSELGRGDELVFSASSQSSSVYAEKEKYEKKVGHKVSWNEFLEANPNTKTLATTSIFDPVMCEIAYRWFSPDGGVIVDPFSGGSVRGIVASKLNRKYYGCDIRQEQVNSNIEQWNELASVQNPTPIWKCGDSQYIHEHLSGALADMIFSCPPYADLEVYSDNPNDISTMSYDDFIEAYREIIKRTVSLLKDDRFACFVVGEVRDKKGIYRNFVGDTVKAFVDAGAKFYNEAILVTQAGSLPMRAGKTFSASRKLGKTHQNVLIFVKGDPKAATQACGEIEVVDELFNEES